jgi:hypothetical protein
MCYTSCKIDNLVMELVKIGPLSILSFFYIKNMN